MLPELTSGRPTLLADCPPSPPSCHSFKSPAAAPADYTHSDYLQAAYLYRTLGFSVFPLYKKQPAVKRWRPLQEHRPTDEHIAWMFDQDRGVCVDGVAAVTGPVSIGLCVRDFDTTDGYVAWARAHPALARGLPTVKTGRGYHVYIRLPKWYGPVYKSWKSGPAKGELLGSSTHYVVLPPSRHPSGKRYTWLWHEPFTFYDLPVRTPEELGWLDENTENESKLSTTQSNTQQQPTDNTAQQSKYVICSRGSGQNVPLELLERDAVMKCLPCGPGQRNACLWDLARTLKALPHLIDAGEDDLRPFVEQWFHLAKAVIDTKSLAVCWSDFKRQWKLVKAPAGKGFDTAVARILSEPFPAEADRYAEAETKNLVAVCVGLQRYAGNAAFYLSCRTAQKVCGFGSYHTAARRLNQLVDDGLLVVVWKGRGGTDRKKATRYRWALLLTD